MTLPTAIPAAALFSLMIGCSGTQKAEPAWPEQPSPSYPSPTDKSHSSESLAASGDIQSSSKPQEAGSPGQSSTSSALAKEFREKKALDTLLGKATYYADSLAGNHTASGDIYDPSKFTAAHKKLTFGTILRITREDNGKVTYVRVNDRGPFGSEDRIVDLSRAAANELDMLQAGVVAVRVEILKTPN